MLFPQLDEFVPAALVEKIETGGFSDAEKLAINVILLEKFRAGFHARLTAFTVQRELGNYDDGVESAGVLRTLNALMAISSPPIPHAEISDERYEELRAFVYANETEI